MLECFFEVIHRVKLHLEIKHCMSAFETKSSCLHICKNRVDVDSLIHDSDTMCHVELQLVSTITEDIALMMIRTNDSVKFGNDMERDLAMLARIWQDAKRINLMRRLQRI